MASTSTIDLPTRAIWYRFSIRARFHDRPGFPVLSRWIPVDKRILDRARAALDTGIVTFYTSTVYPDPFDKTSQPFVMRFLEIRRPDTNIGPDRFLPSWLGYDPSIRKQRLHHASIHYINKVY